MSKIFYPLAFMALLASACATAPADGTASPSPPPPASNTSAETFKYFGLLRYDGMGATLIGCAGEVYLLEGQVFDDAVEEIKRLKADPDRKVWIQVTTNEAPKTDKEGGRIVLEVGEMGRTTVDPCPAK